MSHAATIAKIGLSLFSLLNPRPHTHALHFDIPLMAGLFSSDNVIPFNFYGSWSHNGVTVYTGVVGSSQVRRTLFLPLQTE
jgi:hypothetical protein